jgi:ribose transport system permease protein
MTFERIKTWLPFLTLALLVAIVGAWDTTFLRPATLIGLAGDAVPLFIMALGMTFAIYIGGIDLSAQSMANMTTVIATAALAPFGILAMLICMAAGFALGLVSGYATTKLKVPSFIATLAVGGIALSLGKYFSDSKSVSMDGAQRDAAFGWMIARTGPIPNELIIAAVLLLAALFIERRTTFGRALKAVGAGELAAVASGINVSAVKILAFGISGMLAAVAGLLFSVKLAGGSPEVANGFLLSAIVAVLVGGTPLTGGVGGVLNTAIGTLIVVVIRYSMTFFEVQATHQQMVFGLVLIAAIALTIDRSKLRVVK